MHPSRRNKVLNTVFRQAKSHKLIVASIAAVALVAGLLCVQYYLYAYAMAWHCLHGSYAEAGGHRLRLPISWWKQGTGSYDTYLLVRASPYVGSPESQIVVSPAGPGEIWKTNGEELQATQTMISTMNSHRHSDMVQSSFLVVLNSKRFTLYCRREESELQGIDILSHVSCDASGVPYSYTFDGPPAYEKEAESILSTLE